MALIDVYTDRNEPTGRQIEKKDAHSSGAWHRVFTCLVVNPAHKTAYLQKKTPGRYSFDRPDYMDVTVGGHYEAGEPIEAGVREMEEEIGLTVPFSSLIPLGQRQTSVVLSENYNNNEFQHIFLCPTDRSVSDFNFTDTEVRGLVEIPILEGIKLMRGEIAELAVRGAFVESSSATEIKNLIISKDDFVPAYLKTDEFMIRLFVAAHRYLNGEDPAFLYW